MFKIEVKTPYFEAKRDEVRAAKNKTAEEIAKQVNQLHEWILNQAHLPDEVTSAGLVFFLTNYNYNLENTQKAINAYFKIRSLMLDIFLKQNPTKEKYYKSTEGVTVVPLPKLTEDLRRVTILRLDDKHPEHLDMVKSTAKLYFHPYEVQMYEDLSCGRILIADYKYIHKEHEPLVNSYHLTRCLFISEQSEVRAAKNKTAEEVEEQVNQLHEWILNQAHLPDEVTSAGLEFFLTNYNYNLEDTQKAINAYFKIRSLMPDIFLKQNPTKEKYYEGTEGATVVPLPKLTKDLRRVTILRLDDKYPDHLDMVKTTAKLYFHPYEVQMYEDLSCGRILIADYKNIHKEYEPLVTTYHLTRSLFISENLWGKSGEECHFINVPEHGVSIVEEVRRSLFDKLGAKTFMHDSLEDLHKHVTKDILPVEYGGNEKSVDELKVDWLRTLNEYKPLFDEIEKLVGHEEYNPELPENATFKASYDDYMKGLTYEKLD